MEERTPQQEILTGLRKTIDKRFNEGELRTLCFDLGVDYDGLPGQGKVDKARELVSFLERRDRIPELVETGKQLRPDISWGSVYKVPPEQILVLKDPLPALEKPALEEEQICSDVSQKTDKVLYQIIALINNSSSSVLKELARYITTENSGELFKYVKDLMLRKFFPKPVLEELAQGVCISWGGLPKRTGHQTDH